jgi:hypothetical protein
MEAEVVLAAIVASHSFSGSLSGCPLPDFLRALVAQLNIESAYVAGTDFTLAVPQPFARISIGMLSAANASWQGEEREGASADGCRRAQGGSILLADLSWSANADESDAVFPVIMDGEVHRASLNVKCEKRTAPATQLTRTIRKNGENGHLITIMVVDKGAEIEADNKKFNAAKQGHNVIRISGNASGTEPVATQLTWTVIHEHSAAEPRGTVIQVELDTIYWGR